MSEFEQAEKALFRQQDQWKALMGTMLQDHSAVMRSDLAAALTELHNLQLAEMKHQNALLVGIFRD